jgi:hypothetical protein
MIEVGNLVRITRGQGWNAEEDPGVGIVTDVRKQYPLLDEIKVLWTKNGKTLWENSGRIKVISRA